MTAATVGLAACGDDGQGDESASGSMSATSTTTATGTTTATTTVGTQTSTTGSSTGGSETSTMGGSGSTGSVECQSSAECDDGEVCTAPSDPAGQPGGPFVCSRECADFDGMRICSDDESCCIGLCIEGSCAAP